MSILGRLIGSRRLKVSSQLVSSFTAKSCFRSRNAVNAALPGGNRSDMATAIDRSRPPSRQLLWLELRGILELQAFFAAYPLLRLAPRGDGHPVIVLPGLAASDASTRPLRAYLTEQGYAAHGWKQGPNHGPRAGVEEGMQARLAELAERYQRKVSLIGWTLGGAFARGLARRGPGQARPVVTPGTPFPTHPTPTTPCPPPH